jgi:hypothetical protein
MGGKYKIVLELTAHSSYEVQGKTRDFQDAFLGDLRKILTVTLPDNMYGTGRRKKIGKSSEGQGRRQKGVISHKSNFVLRGLCVSYIIETGNSTCMWLHVYMCFQQRSLNVRGGCNLTYKQKCIMGTK